MKGTVIKRSSTYSIVYDINRNAIGKRQQKWESGFRTKREAQEALTNRLHELQNNEYIIASKSTLGEYLKNWFSDYVETTLAINTVNGYRNIIYKHIIPELGNVFLNKLNPMQVQKLYNKKLSEGLSATSVIFIHRVLHKALEQAYKMQIISKNVSELVEIPRKAKYHAQVLSEIKVKQLLDAVSDTEIFLPILLAVTLGLRRGEVLGLKWSDIDFENGIITVCRTAVKNKNEIIYTKPKTETSNRKIKVSPKFIEILTKAKAEQVNENVDGLIACYNNGLPISQDVLDKRFKACLKRNNLPDIRFHDLRHTNATLMLKNNIAPKIVSERLGHSSIGITMDLYTHVLIEMQNEAADSMDSLIE